MSDEIRNENSEPDVLDLLIERIRKYLAQHEITAQTFAEEHCGISAAGLSYVMNRHWHKFSDQTYLSIIHTVTPPHEIEAVIRTFAGEWAMRRQPRHKNVSETSG